MGGTLLYGEGGSAGAASIETVWRFVQLRCGRGVRRQDSAGAGEIDDASTARHRLLQHKFAWMHAETICAWLGGLLCGLFDPNRHRYIIPFEKTGKSLYPSFATEGRREKHWEYREAWDLLKG